MKKIGKKNVFFLRWISSQKAPDSPNQHVPNLCNEFSNPWNANDGLILQLLETHVSDVINT